MSDENDQNKKLLDLIIDAIKKDNELREEYQIGEKFRFVRDRLTALKSQLEQNLNAGADKQEKPVDVISDLETIVYVYLHNAQGSIIKTWASMLNPGAFYEYSVNRPIYAEKSQVEMYLRSKHNKLKNGYLAVVVQKNEIVKTTDTATDTLNTPLIKVKEGSLKIEKLVSLNVNKDEYTLNETGELIKKPLGI